MEPADWTDSIDFVQASFEEAHPFGQSTMDLGGASVSVLVASTAEQRARGMVGRRFDGFAAMLFVWPDAAPRSFHNWSVPVDLKIGLYDSDRELVEQYVLPTGGGPVRGLKAARYAIEVPTIVELPARLELPPETLTAASVQKKTPEQVNLRPADLGAPERCSNCEYYLGGGACELVEQSGADLVCDLFAPDEDAVKMYPDLSQYPTSS
jgi:uncharacterized membrane protein (UPF0127 family)